MYFIYRRRRDFNIRDTPCKYNEECPFYKKYELSKFSGGCLNGFCEMPVNIKTIGYKEYNELGTNAAICYNCNYKKGCKGLNMVSAANQKILISILT